MSDDINYMDLNLFKELGYLQEVNRQFFRPRGLALGMIVNKDGDYEFAGIWDYRDDPEGMNFDGKDLDRLAELAEEPQAEFYKHVGARQQGLGYIIQPVRREA